MDIAPFTASVVIILTFGFTLAMLLGMLTQKANLSPIPGYLIAGYLIGPYSPGVVADIKVAEQLAEIGVILMMFNVGLHIKIQDLLGVKKVAIPGALFQILISATAGFFLALHLGWTSIHGITFGIAISVASTMILVRLITDYKLLNTVKGHISIGWLIVEDLVTVLFLLLLPALATLHHQGEISAMKTVQSMGMALFNFMLLIVLMATIGRRYFGFVLNMMIKSKSKELLTLAVLALTFQVAIGAFYFFGISIALGAFIAGAIMGQMRIREEISHNGEGLKDIFVIIFFIAIGMLFNPSALLENPGMLIGTLSIILLIKPLAAFLIIFLMKYPLNTALLVSIALAQIGEFSFIVAEEATRMNLLPEEGYDIIVASSLLSISLNPLLFRWYSLYTARLR